MAGLVAKESIPVFFGILAVAIPSIWLLRRRKNDDKAPPMAPAGIFETIREVSGERAFLFTKEMADAVGSFIYRVRLPVPGGVIIIGDPVVQREILRGTYVARV